jgi:hypothetical protein
VKAKPGSGNGSAAFSSPDPALAPEPGDSAPATSRVADELLEKDEQRKAATRERVRRFRERQKAEAVETDKRAAWIATPEDVRETAVMFDFLWTLAVVPAGKGRIRPLREPEAMRAGSVFAPLVKKYLPMVADWQLEVSAALFLVALVKECRVEVATDDAQSQGGQPDHGGGGPQGVGEINAGAESR